MKKYLIAVTLLLNTASAVWAQKFGYIDTDFILSKMTEAGKAQSELDGLAGKWQQEIQAKYEEVNKLEQDYRAEEILLTPEMKQERLVAIDAKKKEATEYNNKIFGFEGMLYLKKKELMQPVRDKVYEAVTKVIRKRKLEFLFDKADEGAGMIYSDPRHDYSDYVLEELGLGGEDNNLKGNTVRGNTTPAGQNGVEPAQETPPSDTTDNNK